MARYTVSADQIRVWISRRINEHPTLVAKGGYVRVPLPYWCDAPPNECNWHISYWYDVTGYEEIVASVLQEAQSRFSLVVSPSESVIRIHD
ncbi:hypothetical protein [Jeongeupia chitinilytica]|uniref:Uncharacterized protein n=1 Tax=Jeongeupia chitinilytica TaxID=1041641 RepID=A0ABQ3GXF8_9NEIS|nr:hypothetical protein [Jeongeupia chitinilytica]GHD59740.1 hypothetical protein GCM10007350_11400 [Jeongeupia chitinilytica]